MNGREWEIEKIPKGKTMKINDLIREIARRSFHLLFDFLFNFYYVFSQISLRDRSLMWIDIFTVFTLNRSSSSTTEKSQNTQQLSHRLEFSRWCPKVLTSARQGSLKCVKFNLNIRSTASTSIVTEKFARVCIKNHHKLSTFWPFTSAKSATRGNFSLATYSARGRTASSAIHILIIISSNRFIVKQTREIKRWVKLKHSEFSFPSLDDHRNEISQFHSPCLLQVFHLHVLNVRRETWQRASTRQS